MQLQKIFQQSINGVQHKKVAQYFMILLHFLALKGR